MKIETISQAPISPLESAPFGFYRKSLYWRWRIGKNSDRLPDEPKPRSITKLRKALCKAAPIFDVEHRGVKLRLYPAENKCDLKIAIYDDHPVHEEFALARHAFEKATVFVDIGSNVGIYSLVARTLMPAFARVIGFEPDPRTVRKLRQNLDFNAASNVTLINAAVGPEETMMTLYAASTKNVGRNTLKRSLAGNSEERGVNVSVRPLATMLREENVSHIDVLKIDVEGFEAAALGPFFTTADPALWPSYVMIEIAASAHWEVDLIALMHELGYETVYETKNDMHLRRIPDIVTTDAGRAALSQ